MAHQRKLWSNPRIVAERREPAESVMGRELELPGRRYDATERRIAAAHLALVVAESSAKKDRVTA
jgi:hypothetical protein